MTYARLDDNAPWNPKVASLTDAEFRAWIASICYASQHRTNGLIPPQALRLVGASARVVDGLVEKGVWEANGSGFYVHDYLKKQRSREEIMALSAQRRAAAEARWNANRMQDA